MDAVNHSYCLAVRPTGLPTRESWEYTEAPVGLPGNDEVLIEVLFISLDPAMRGWMNDTRSYVAPVGIGDVMRALAVGRVAESNHADFAVGDHVSGVLGVQEYAVAHGAGLRKVDPEAAPLPVWLGALGMPGMTAYFGLLDIGQPAAGETVVVSGAAGAVGQIAGQIAKLKDCRVVGIAGGPEKCSYVVQELGFDAAIDYKNQDIGAGLREHCPKGIDIYFDNVGGEILDAALAGLARRGRVIICGAISQYNATGPIAGPANYLSLLVNHGTMTGFVVSDYGERFGEAARELNGWRAAGNLKSREDVVDGLETFPETLLKLFTGDNQGKLVLAVT
jgi:NADPH-dependent curcumin reductase CurA